MVRDSAFWVVWAARAAMKISFLLTYPTFEDAVFNLQGQNKITLLKSDCNKKKTSYNAGHGI